MLDYKKYKTFDRIMIQFIMWMTKGPTDKNTKIEYTDWNKEPPYKDGQKASMLGFGYRTRVLELLERVKKELDKPD